MTFNEVFTPRTLNILKASLPYISPSMQRIVSNFVKIEEFNLMIKNLNNSFDSELSACEYDSADSSKTFNPTDFLNAVKPFLNDSEKELIDMFFNMMNAFQIYNVYKSLPPSFTSGGQNFDNAESESQTYNTKAFETSDSDNTSSTNTSAQNNFNIETLKNLLSPSQRAMFETCSSMMNSDAFKTNENENSNQS